MSEHDKSEAIGSYFFGQLGMGLQPGGGGVGEVGVAGGVVGDVEAVVY